MPENTNQFHIPFENLSEFWVRMSRINNRAKKLGFPEIKFEEVDKYYKKKTLHDISGLPREEMVEYHVINLAGVQPVLSGWRWLGKLEHLDIKGTNIVLGDVPKEYLNCPPNCNHCNTLRQRNDTFILQNVESGSIKQVGRSCLTDFFNSDDPMRHASFLEGVYQVFNEVRELQDLDDGPRRSTTAEVGDVLRVASILNQRQGWISAQRADELMCYSTGAMTRLIVSGQEKLEKVTKEEQRKAEADIEGIISWMRSDETAAKAADSTFLHNLVSLGKFDHVSLKNVGILAAAIPAYEQHLRQKLDQELAGKSQHVGTPGEKLESHEVVVIGKRVIPGDIYGDKVLYNFRDKKDNVLVWFSSGADLAKIGNRIHINGTIDKERGHGEYQGVKQTSLKRVSCNEDKLYDLIENGKPLKDIQKALKKPVNVDHQNAHTKLTPLMKSIKQGREDVTRALLEHGADPNRVCDKGLSALDYAQELQLQTLAELLREYGAEATARANHPQLERQGEEVTAAPESLASVAPPTEMPSVATNQATHLPDEVLTHQARREAYAFVRDIPFDIQTSAWRNCESFNLDELCNEQQALEEFNKVEGALKGSPSLDYLINRALAKTAVADLPLIVRTEEGYRALSNTFGVGAARHRGLSTIRAIVGEPGPSLVLNAKEPLNREAALDATKPISPSTPHTMSLFPEEGAEIENLQPKRAPSFKH